MPQPSLRRAAIVAPIRTPVGKFGGALASVTAGELGGVIEGRWLPWKRTAPELGGCAGTYLRGVWHGKKQELFFGCQTRIEMSPSRTYPEFCVRP